MNFNYTEAWTNFKSSLVKGVWYDDHTRRVLVRLDGGKQYVYSNVDRDWAAAIGDAESEGGSAGTEYNYFRNNRPNGTSGAYAHDYIPVVRVSGLKIGGTVPQTYTFAPVSSRAGNNTSEFVVSYTLEDKEFSSTVKSADLVSAAQDVSGKLIALGLQPKLTGVVAKS